MLIHFVTFTFHTIDARSGKIGLNTCNNSAQANQGLKFLCLWYLVFFLYFMIFRSQEFSSKRKSTLGGDCRP